MSIKGFYRIMTAATSQPKGKLYERVSRRSGESRMIEAEKLLRAQGIEFVEDFDANGQVLVRYGAWANDETWDAYCLREHS